jgi:hypothetical protein
MRAPKTAQTLILALHQKSGYCTRGGSSVLNKILLFVVACNFGAKPLILLTFDWRFSFKQNIEIRV